MIDGRDGLVAPEKKKGENKEKNTLLRLRNALKTPIGSVYGLCSVPLGNRRV